MEQVRFNILFSEIVKGYSVFNHPSFGQIYLKHHSYLENGDIENQYSEYFQEARDNNIPTYKEQEEYIIKNKLWTDSDELDIISQEQFLENIRLTYSKEYLNSRRLQYKKTIDDAEVKLNALRLRKDSFIKTTAENYANGKLFSYKISNSFFLDRDCSKLISGEISDSDYSKLLEYMKDNQLKFNHLNIKKLSISSSFSNMFYLADNNVYNFYGKPIVNLTSYQMDLFLWGGYFKRMLEDHRNSIPKNIQDNPEELINWIELRKNATDAKVINEEQTGNMSIVGATKEDYKMLGMQVTTGVNNKINQKLKEKGVLTKEDLFAMENS